MPVSRIFDLLDYQSANYPNQEAVVGKSNGEWKKYSIQDFIVQSNTVSLGLLALGIQKGDTIASISNNRPEWNFLDFGILQTGAVHVPIYPTISESEYKFILNDAGIKYVFVSDKDLAQKIKNVQSEVPSMIEIYSFEQVEGTKNWSEILTLGMQKNDQKRLNEIKSSISDLDLATMIYTSGTTGNPKGVMLSHRNLVSNFISCEKLPPVNYHHRALSFLPLCHVYERMLTYLYIYLGVSIWYAESIEKIGENLKEVKPHVFSTVPRLLEKVYDKIVSKGKELTGIKNKLFFWALDLGLQYEANGENGIWYEIKLALANKLIFNKWREALGGNVMAVVSGGAALQPRLARVFWAAKIHVLEGYGLTETSPVIAVNFMQPGMQRFGTVGPIIPGVQVKFADDGEILCKGDNVMMGYYKRPDLTSEAVDKDGWFHTGDIGLLEENKFLKITDRKKEIFKTSGGKYVAPQSLENKFKESPFIEQIMVIGEGKNFPAALIVPAFAYIERWCISNSMPALSHEEVIRNEQIISQIRAHISEFNKEFGKTEQVKKFELVLKEWTVESGDLTPTLKLKRKIILEKNKELVDKIYRD